MGNTYQTQQKFAPLEPARAQELEFIIDHAANNKQAVVIDPDQGVKGAQPVSLISPNANTNGLVRYGCHYG
jgi:apolipoprotein N-acyltransferase